jgi:hypothetical protein
VDKGRERDGRDHRKQRNPLDDRASRDLVAGLRPE